MAKWHQLRGLVSGIAKHVTLITSTNLLGSFCEMAMDTLCNVRALLLNVDQDFAVHQDPHHQKQTQLICKYHGQSSHSLHWPWLQLCYQGLAQGKHQARHLRSDRKACPGVPRSQTL
ncbi:LOW QUALITY PROTEIN: hypothetical protein RJ641_020832, partial [Dillenia turbinata]